MITGNELRINNLIYRKFYKNDQKEVREMILPYFSQLDRLEPIPITEEWLLKLGFKNSNMQDCFYTNGNMYGISTSDHKFRFIQGNLICQLVLSEINYVHQLQNLYFALTGKELECVGKD